MRCSAVMPTRLGSNRRAASYISMAAAGWPSTVQAVAAHDSHPAIGRVHRFVLVEHLAGPVAIPGHDQGLGQRADHEHLGRPLDEFAQNLDGLVRPVQAEITEGQHAHGAGAR